MSRLAWALALRDPAQGVVIRCLGCSTFCHLVQRLLHLLCFAVCSRVCRWFVLWAPGVKRLPPIDLFASPRILDLVSAVWVSLLSLDRSQAQQTGLGELKGGGGITG